MDAESIDMSRVYFAARWDKGTADYINCPMDRAEYDRFFDALLAAEAAESKEWEKLEYFEGCLPIEVLATRGRDTLRFGPMKPVGLRDPRTGKTPWAVVQLRKENLRADSYNLVGFQNHLKFGEQARVLRLIPGLENARFLRYGQIHRNTYICAPVLLDEDCAAVLRDDESPPMRPKAGEWMGRQRSFLRGRFAGSRDTRNRSRQECWRGFMPRRWRAARSLYRFRARRRWARWCITSRTRIAKNFQPANITFDLLEPLEEEVRKKIRDKKERHRMRVRAGAGGVRCVAGGILDRGISAWQVRAATSSFPSCSPFLAGRGSCWSICRCGSRASVFRPVSRGGRCCSREC